MKIPVLRVSQGHREVNLSKAKLIMLFPQTLPYPSDSHSQKWQHQVCKPWTWHHRWYYFFPYHLNQSHQQVWLILSTKISWPFSTFTTNTWTSTSIVSFWTIRFPALYDLSSIRSPRDINEIFVCIIQWFLVSPANYMLYENIHSTSFASHYISSAQHRVWHIVDAQ